MRWTRVFFMLVSVFSAAGAFAAETATYAYDAKGRLVRVVRSGSVNNGVTTQYSHDRADNRTNVKTTNAPN